MDIDGGSGSEICTTSAAAAASSLLSLTTKELSADSAITTNSDPGLVALHDVSVVAALRTALSIHGDVYQAFPSHIKRWLADHFTNTRVEVDKHTAASVLYEAFSQSKVIIVRNFPGAMKSTRRSVRDVVIEDIPEESLHYYYNRSRCAVHALLRERYDNREDLQQQRDWWSTINILPDTGKLSSGTLWSAVSRRGKSLLHVDDTDGVSTQWVGRKVWVFVKLEEALKHGIRSSSLDSMRNESPGLYRFTDWQQCPSFEWLIVNEGDTLFLPRDRLHAVCCVGDEDAVASSIYCHIAGTPAVTEVNTNPRLRKKAKLTHFLPPPAQLPHSTVISVAAKAWEVAPSSKVPTVARTVMATLVDTDHTLSSAATMAGSSVSTVRRWNKRLRETGSADDEPRSGRPRDTTPLEDAAIVRASELNHFASNKDIRHQLALPVSEDTIGRRLDAAGLPSCAAAGKLHCTDKERQNRLAFCHGYEHWTAEQWESVIFGDEVTMEGEGRKRHQRVRRPKGHRFDSEYTIHKQIYSPS